MIILLGNECANNLPKETKLPDIFSGNRGFLGFKLLRSLLLIKIL